MLQLNEKIAKEIMNTSNHQTEESVQEAFEQGVIEIFPDKQTYLDAGWSLDNQDHFSVLSDGKVVYFE